MHKFRKNIKVKKKYDYLLFFLLCFMPILNWTVIRKESYLVQFILALYLTVRKNSIFKKSFIRVFLLWILLMMFQAIIFGEGTFVTAIGQLMFISYPFFLVLIFKSKIPEYFVKIVYLLSIISLVFYFPTILSTTIYHLLWSFSKSLNLDVYHTWKTGFIIYSLEPMMQGTTIIRNSGAFSEPGYYASYLAMAIVWNLILTKKVWNKENIILSIAMFTTLSTVGYISIFFIFIIWYIRSKHNFVLKFFSIFIIFLIGLYLFSNLEFLSTKIEKRYNRDKDVSTGQIRGRMGATLMNLKEIKKHYFFGKGLMWQSRFSTGEKFRFGDGSWNNTNSWSDYLVKLGAFGFLFFIYWYFTGIKRYLFEFGHDKNLVFLIFGTIFLLLLTQPILLTPAFFMYIYFGEIKQTKINIGKQNNEKH